MVRLYFETKDGEGKDKSKFVDIYYGSILKSYVLGWLGLMGIAVGIYGLFWLIGVLL